MSEQLAANFFGIVESNADLHRLGFETVCFASVADEIVKYASQTVVPYLASQYGVDKKSAFTNKDFRIIADKIDTSFHDKKMGYKELFRMAQKEIAILLMRRFSEKYSSVVVEGPSPLEFYDKNYRSLFDKLGLPSASISIIDPNLHKTLRIQKLFTSLNKSEPA